MLISLIRNTKHPTRKFALRAGNLALPRPRKRFALCGGFANRVSRLRETSEVGWNFQKLRPTRLGWS